MKICQIVPCFPYKEHLNGFSENKGYHIGGVEKHVYFLSKELLKVNELTIITTKSPQHDQLSELNLGADIIRLSQGPGVYSTSFPIDVLKHLIPTDYNIIHAHTPTLGIADLAALRNVQKKTPFVITYHNDISKGGFIGNSLSLFYNYSLGKYLLNHSDRIIATTESYARNSPRLKKHLNKVKIIPNGVDTDIFRPNLDGTVIRRKHNISDFERIILFVGLLDHYKGCDYLLTAFQKVLKSIPDAHLIYVGKGPLEVELKKISKQVGIDNKVTFAGYVRDQELPLYYVASDLFTLPSVSKHEGFGIVQLEAMASGKPVITTNLPGVRDVDAEELATIHVPTQDAETLSREITRLLNDEIAKKKMGLLGRSLIIEKYSWKTVGEQVEDLYRSL